MIGDGGDPRRRVKRMIRGPQAAASQYLAIVERGRAMIRERVTFQSRPLSGCRTRCSLYASASYGAWKLRQRGVSSQANCHELFV